MIDSVSKLTWIKSQLLPKESASNAASRLNTIIEIDNPTPRPDIPAPIDLVNIREVVPDAEAFAVLESRTWNRIIDAINMGDRIAISQHIAALYAGKLITAETIVKLQPFLNNTIPDPNWMPKIKTTLAKQAGFDIVLVNEVVESMNSSQLNNLTANNLRTKK